MNNVLDFGAKGDGITNDTVAFQKAIDAGGTVYVPDGKYVCGTLYLKSNGGLELAPNAEIIASLNPADYSPKDFCQQENGSTVAGGHGGHLIVALEQHDIFVHGGKFNGNGNIIYDDHTIYNDIFDGGPAYKHPKWRPMQLFFICECKNVRLSDIDITDTTAWCVFVHGCEWVSIRGLHITSSPYIWEDDGIDIDCSSHVTVSDCIIDVGDDAFTLRGHDARLKNKRPCEWVTIQNCIFRSAYAHGIRIGVGGGTIRHCQFNNISVHDSHTAIHINSKYSDKGRGVDIHDLAFRNFHIDCKQLAIVQLDYKFVKEHPSENFIRNIFFENIDGRCSLPSFVRGNDTGMVSNIVFSDINLAVVGDNTIDPILKRFLMIQEMDGVFELKKVHNVRFKNVHLDIEHPEAWKCKVAERDCTDVKTDLM